MEITKEGVEKKFGFKGISLGKNTAPKKLQPGVLNEETVERKETDFITGVEGTEIESESGRTAKPEELVIPLQPNCLFKGLKREKSGDTKSNEGKKRKIEKTDSPKADPVRDDLDADAMNELLEEAQRENEDWENRDLDAPRNLTIPGQDNRNLDENSDSGSGKEDTDYEKVPISSFGLAMLRGMGWKEGEGIGNGDRKKVIDPIQAVARPKGLGLGADRSAYQTKNQVTGKSRTKRDEEELELKKGAFCQITEGKNEDMYGEVISLDEESTRVFVKLTLGDSISVSQFKIRLVSKTEYGKFSKYINKGKADKYKAEEEKKKETREIEAESSRKEEKNGRESRKDGSRKEERSHEKRKRKLWLRPQLRVRIVDKTFSKGKYFKEKVRVLSVLDQETCECRTEGGKLLELKQSQLETVIPRDSRFVCVIKGQHAGSLGEILEKDKGRSRAMVQLLTDRERVLEVAYDDICEYTGDVEADLDY